MRAPRPLGVLGGMGPLATARFYEALVRATPARVDQDHIRTVIWSDPAIPDRTAAILGHGPSPVPAMLAGARQLRRLGARVIATPCNTAHRYLPEVSRIARVKMIDMVDETLSRASLTGSSSAAILGTRGTRAARLYDSAAERHGLRIAYPTEREQTDLIDRAILLVKEGRSLKEAETLIALAASAAQAAGADVVVAACTEIPLVMATAAASVTMIDSIDCLAAACVRVLRPALLAAA
ncbi:aspartate/glutamate racemase family protein [Microbacterium sp. NPDC089695]|uniref:aspartate/glutamate racemase family protein n=1 Tax=Microbacterium sp. NPDC089695 TaxID=3364198 RepID=UPI003829251B